MKNEWHELGDQITEVGTEVHDWTADKPDTEKLSDLATRMQALGAKMRERGYLG